MRAPWEAHRCDWRSGIVYNGGGGGQQQVAQSTQSSSAPPAFIQPYLQGAIGDLSSWYNANKTAPTYYTGETVAPLSTQSQGAVNLASNLANDNPIVPNSVTSLNKFLSGSYLDPTTNPDFLKAISAATQPVTDQFNNQILPGITSTFEGAGRSNSGAGANAVDQAVKSYGTTVNNAAATAGSNYYTTALNQMLQANGLVPSLNSASWQNVSGLGAAGTTVDQQRQAQDSSNQAAYNYNSNAQMNYISQYLAMLNGGYPGGETTGSSFGTTYQPTNSFSSLLGGGLGLAGLGLQAYSAFSDVRLKENIEHIGESKNGTPLYFYTYKGDPTPRIGPMAQEVAERTPEAVHLDPAGSGYLKVDYPKALGLF